MGYLQEIRKSGREANPFFLLMDIDIISFGNGEADLVMPVRPDMLNGAGWMQGGLFTALCDEAMALALFTILDEDCRIATVSESTSFLQGVRSGMITAHGQVTKRGRHIAFTEGWIKANSDGSLRSKTSASFAIR